MNVIKWVLIIYCSISLLSLFNEGIRFLLIESFEELYSSFNKKKKYGVKTVYIHLLFDCLGNLITIIFRFLFGPIVFLCHFPNGLRYETTPSRDTEQAKPINKEYLRPPLVIKIKKNVPFTPVGRQVIYFEDSFNETLNKYISNKYNDIVKIFNDNGYDFIYLPKVIKNINFENARYVNPTLNERTIVVEINRYHEIKNKLLSSIEDSTLILTSGLLRYWESREDFHIFSYYQFSNLDEFEIWEQFKAYLSCVGRRRTILYSIDTDKPKLNSEDFADANFDSQAQLLIKEIKERIEALKQKGINEMVLKSIFSFESVKLSRLVITSDCRIILPDYNNLEITMHPLPKAIFILFLNHSEGILFKNLIDHRDELIQIYKKVSGRENIAKMKHSIDNVVNPTLNSINEKCSRIREAFIKHFDESLAKNYYITGERANPKRIILNRDLVDIEWIKY